MPFKNNTQKKYLLQAANAMRYIAGAPGTVIPISKKTWIYAYPSFNFHYLNFYISDEKGRPVLTGIKKGYHKAVKLGIARVHKKYGYTLTKKGIALAKLLQ